MMWLRKLCVIASLIAVTGLYYAFILYSPISRNAVVLEINNNSIKTILNSSLFSNSSRFFVCNQWRPVTTIMQRGEYHVLYNYIKATRSFSCNESVTYTTHGDLSLLDNLVPLLERWQGPISITLYAPGTDFQETVQRIRYLRQCSSPLIKEFVSFHLFFNINHASQPFSAVNPRPEEQGKDVINCSLKPEFGWNLKTFRRANKLSYPINVARNIAKEMAATYFVLASDIELYPSPHLIPRFLDMIKKHRSKLEGGKSKVFVLPIFEVDAGVAVLPRNKSELQEMLKKNTAIPFHKYICESCHRIPMQNEWQQLKDTLEVNVMHVGKRQIYFRSWEPLYIGTKSDPSYDEQLTWEGQRDKMVQAYVLCVLDYEFHILDNAFLVHRQGIKRTSTKSESLVNKQSRVIRDLIAPKLNKLYGRRPGCYL